MSLSRFENISDVLKKPGPIKGQTVSDSILRSIAYDVANLEYINTDKLNIESHIYSLNGDYLKSKYYCEYTFDDENKSFIFDISSIFNSLQLYNSAYKACFCFLIDLYGNFDTKPLFLQEISPDGTELKLVLKKALIEEENSTYVSDLKFFRDIAGELKGRSLLNNVVINFGSNYNFNITNIKVDCEDEYVVYIKLLSPISDEINENDTAYISFKILDDVIDSFLLQSPVVEEGFNKLQGPNFDFDVTDAHNATIYKSWNNLLSSEINTTNRLISEIVSSSRSIPLNIDYTHFSNFVFYGSAEERIKNFDYKLSLIDHYVSSSRSIEQSSASLIPESLVNIGKDQRNIELIKDTFDGFEKFLYYETGSIFTYDIKGYVKPVPKYVSGSNYLNFGRGSSEYYNWYVEMTTSASLYDFDNEDRLYWSQPDHILRDSNNSQYIVFLNMMGEHFDNVYSYVRELTQIHRRDEHHKRGIPNKLLPIYAESLGWNLQDGRQLSDLWLYKLGRTQSGNTNLTGSLPSVAHEDLSYQTWRRIVNNLPLLLKSKGTERSVKTLISIYGIPFTLISVKEYGGPKTTSARPNYIEDRFQYALNFSGSQYLQMRRKPISSSFYSGYTNIVPSSVSFRFRTDYSSSVSMSLWAIGEYSDSNKTLHHLELVHRNSVSTGSYMGTYTYGYIRYKYIIGPEVDKTVRTVTSSYMPLYDNDFYDVRLSANDFISENTAWGGTLRLDVQKASDCVDNRISISSSIQITSVDTEDWLYGFGATSSLGDGHYVFLGGVTSSMYAGSNSSRFIGQIQNYKEYIIPMSKQAFDEHTLNPGAYYIDNYSSSYDSLSRYYPLGGDNLRFDHTVKTIITSSHPNRNTLPDSYATAYNFTGGETDQYSSFSEKFYTFVPSIGAHNLKSQRIRKENSYLYRELSPFASAEKSEYDNAQRDSNRLAIVFSPTDQINRDIINEFGSLDFDQYIGDPLDTKRDMYPSFRILRKDYWKKYVGVSNLNEFIKIFSLYDYSLFEQVKQLLPARSNAILGVLIEPTILERPKIERKYPTLESLLKETTLTGLVNPIEIFYNYLTGSIDNINTVEICYNYLTSSLDISNDILIYLGSHLTNTGSRQIQGSTDVNYKLKNLERSSEQVISHKDGDNASVLGNDYGNIKYPALIDYESVSHKNSDNAFMLEDTLNPGDIYSLNESEVFSHKDSKNKEQLGATSSMFTYVLGGDVKSHDEGAGNVLMIDGDIDKSDLLQGFSISHPSVKSETIQYSFKRNGQRVRVTQSLFILQDYSGIAYPVVDKFYSDLLRIENRVGNFKFQSTSQKFTLDLLYSDSNAIYKYTSSAGDLYTNFTSTEFKEFLKKYDYYVKSDLYVYRRYSLGEVIQPITGSRIVKNYSKVIYYYSSSNYDSGNYYDRLELAGKIANNNYYSRSLAPANYQYAEDSVYNRIRFSGCKLSGPDFNHDSLETVDGGPVVSFIEVENTNLTV